MTELYLYKRRVDSLFQLLGYQENDISRAIAYALAACLLITMKENENTLVAEYSMLRLVPDFL